MKTQLPAHIWEHHDLTFSNVFEILAKVFTGEMLTTEVVDGVDVLVRVDHNGLTRFSRNPKDALSGGRLFSEILDSRLSRQIVEGYRAIDESFSGAWWPFGFSNRTWLKCTIAPSGFSRVISYPESIVTVNEVLKVNPITTIVDNHQNPSRILETISGDQVVTVTGQKWKIICQPPISLKNKSGSGVLIEAQNKLRFCMKESGLAEDHTIKDFITASLLMGPLKNLNCTQETKIKVVDAIIGGKKIKTSHMSSNLSRTIRRLTTAGNSIRLIESCLSPIKNTITDFEEQLFISQLGNVGLNEGLGVESHIPQIKGIKFTYNNKLIISEGKHYQRNRALALENLSKQENMRKNPLNADYLPIKRM